MKEASLLLTAALSFAALPASARPGELRGRIDLIERDGTRVPAGGAVVWIPGLRPAAEGSAPAIAQKEKRFHPHVVAVPPGTTLPFPNHDPIFHNVFSRSRGNQFDLGLYRNGESRQFRFDNPGVVRVFCNIHAQMAAYVLVLEGAAFAVADEDGHFRIREVPEGSRRVHLWHEKAAETSAAVEIAGAATTWSPTLDASGYRLVPHKNKYGKDYPPATRDGDRY